MKHNFCLSFTYAIWFQQAKMGRTFYKIKGTHLQREFWLQHPSWARERVMERNKWEKVNSSGFTLLTTFLGIDWQAFLSFQNPIFLWSLFSYQGCYLLLPLATIFTIPDDFIVFFLFFSYTIILDDLNCQVMALRTLRTHNSSIWLRNNLVLWLRDWSGAGPPGQVSCLFHTSVTSSFNRDNNGIYCKRLLLWGLNGLISKKCLEWEPDMSY